MPFCIITDFSIRNDKWRKKATAGLRVSEATNLLVSDIDSKNMQIRVRQAKGKKDRYTLLSIENLKILRNYWKACRPQNWLFPGFTSEKPLTTRSIQKIFERAKN
jgi:integrase/recombinase XerD